MPAYSSPSNGPFQSIAPQPIRSGVLTFGGAGSQSTPEVYSDGLPGLRAWFLQTAGAAVTVQLEFADGNSGNNVVQWRPLVAAYGIVAVIPSLVNYSLGSRRYRATLTAAGAAVVAYRLNATLN